MMGYGMWLEPHRGQVPITWGVCPWIYENYPAMMEYYYDSMTEKDSFAPATSGYGYFTQDLVPNLDEFTMLEIRANRFSDLHVGLGWGGDRLKDKRDEWFDDRALPGYVLETGGKSFLGFTPENRPVIGTDGKLFYWWHRFGKGTEEQLLQRTADYIQELAAKHEPPYFIPVYGGNPSGLYRLTERLPAEKFEVVPIENMVYLAKEAGQIQVDQDHLEAVSDGNDLKVNLSVRNMGDAPYSGTVTVKAPAGWVIKPAQWQYPELKAKTGSASQEFTIVAPADCGPGSYKITFDDSATAMSDLLVVTK